MSEAKNSLGYVDADYLKKVAEVINHVKQRSYELMRMQQGHKVLDVGCGPATDTIPLSRFVGPQGQVFGVDFDEEMIEKAEDNAKSANVATQIIHKHADATSLPFEDNYFDSCRSERVFQHLSNPEKALSEMNRVTRTGGWVVIVDTDWATMSIDTPELDIERRITSFKVANTLNNGCAGRQLYRLFKNQGLVDLTIELFAIPMTNYTLHRQIALLDEVEKSALAAGVITLEELERWRTSLERADSEGVYFSNGNQIMLAGRKP